MQRAISPTAWDAATLVLPLLLAASPALARPSGTVRTSVRIAEGSGGFAGPLAPGDEFGVATATLGDLDGDGITDVAIGARNDDDGGPDRGAIWMLFLTADGRVRAQQKVSASAGGFTGTLDRNDRFGVAISPIGDLNDDGTIDLAVGASGDDDGGTNKGAVWILFLAPDGTVRGQQKISDTQGGFTGRLDPNDLFGSAVAGPGDFDGDGIEDLAVGAPFDDDGGSDQGAVWMLYLRADGTVREHRKISATSGGFTGPLSPSDWFGESITAMGDLDGDGTTDLTAGARGDDDGGDGRGAVWVLFLAADGTVRTQQKISDTEGGFTGGLEAGDAFGISVASLADLDGDRTTDLAVGAFFDDDGGTDRGAVWILFLAPDGTVRGEQKISATSGGFQGPLADGDWFGSAVTALDDLDGDGADDLAVGARRDTETGAAWVLFLDGAPPCPADLDGDRDVDDADLALLLAAWGPCRGCPADLDGDGMVGQSDVNLMLQLWGACKTG